MHTAYFTDYNHPNKSKDLPKPPQSGTLSRELVTDIHEQKINSHGNMGICACAASINVTHYFCFYMNTDANFCQSNNEYLSIVLKRN